MRGKWTSALVLPLARQYVASSLMAHTPHSGTAERGERHRESEVLDDPTALLRTEAPPLQGHQRPDWRTGAAWAGGAATSWTWSGRQSGDSAWGLGSWGSWRSVAWGWRSDDDNKGRSWHSARDSTAKHAERRKADYTDPPGWPGWEHYRQWKRAVRRWDSTTDVAQEKRFDRATRTMDWGLQSRFEALSENVIQGQYFLDRVIDVLDALANIREGDDMRRVAREALYNCRTSLWLLSWRKALILGSRVAASSAL